MTGMQVVDIAAVQADEYRKMLVQALEDEDMDALVDLMATQELRLAQLQQAVIQLQTAFEAVHNYLQIQSMTEKASIDHPLWTSQ